MKAVDTNILLRLFIDDDKNQSQAVYNIIVHCIHNQEKLLISVIVILEMMWVLESCYGFSRENIVGVINDVLSMPVFFIENRSALLDFIRAAQDTRYDLSDMLIAHLAKHLDCDMTLTFDKKAAKYSLFELLEY